MKRVGVQQRPNGGGRVVEVVVAPAEDGGRAGGRGCESEQHAQRRALAGAVGSEKASDRAGAGLEGEVLDGGDRAVTLGHTVDADRGGLHALDATDSEPVCHRPRGRCWRPPWGGFGSGSPAQEGGGRTSPAW